MHRRETTLLREIGAEEKWVQYFGAGMDSWDEGNVLKQSVAEKVLILFEEMDWDMRERIVFSTVEKGFKKPIKLKKRSLSFKLSMYILKCFTRTF